MSSDADTRRRAEFVAARRAEMRVMREDFEVVERIVLLPWAPDIRATWDADKLGRPRVWFGTPTDTKVAAVLLPQLREAENPAALVFELLGWSWPRDQRFRGYATKRGMG